MLCYNSEYKHYYTAICYNKCYKHSRKRKEMKKNDFVYTKSNTISLCRCSSTPDKTYLKYFQYIFQLVCPTVRASSVYRTSNGAG